MRNPIRSHLLPAGDVAGLMLSYRCRKERVKDGHPFWWRPDLPDRPNVGVIADLFIHGQESRTELAGGGDNHPVYGDVIYLWRFFMPTKTKKTDKTDEMLEIFKIPGKDKDGKRTFNGVALGMHLPLSPMKKTSLNDIFLGNRKPK